jgi:HD superfamily phosphohydrolase
MDTESSRLCVTEPTEFGYKDQVHGYLFLPIDLRKFIDVHELQRLEDIKQLGPASKVYRGAVHNRLSHCIGTSYLANRFVKRIRLCYPELGVTELDVFLVTVAGLYHDIGHGPFSHLFEEFMKSRGIDWDHEEVGCNIIRVKLSYLFSEHGGEESMETVIAMIKGEYDEKEQSKNPGKRFLYEIVHNSRTGIDVDKFDYYLRDSYNANVKISYNADRLQECFVIKEGKIMYPSKEYHNIFEFFHTRNILHATLYNHNAVWQIDEMVLQIFREGISHFDFIEEDHTLEKFLGLNDGILRTIGSKTWNLLQNRILYKTILELHPRTKVEKENALILIKKEIEDEFENDKDLGVPSSIITKWKRIGFEESNHPLREMEFVNKEGKIVKMSDQSSVLPRDHDTYIIRVISTNHMIHKKIKERLNNVFSEHKDQIFY